MSGHHRRTALLSHIRYISQTHWDRGTHICVSNLNHHWFRQWLGAEQATSHYPNPCWNIVNRTHGNIFQWNLNQNTTTFIEENAFENVVRKMLAILFRYFCGYQWQLDIFSPSFRLSIITNTLLFTKQWFFNMADGISQDLVVVRELIPANQRNRIGLPVSTGIYSWGQALY